MILTDYGGSGLGLRDATVVMEEINRSGQMFNMGTRLRHGSEVQKAAALPAQDRERRMAATIYVRDGAQHRHDQDQDH